MTISSHPQLNPYLKTHCKLAHQSQSQNCTTFTSHNFVTFVNKLFFCFVPKYLGLPVLTKYFVKNSLFVS